MRFFGLCLVVFAFCLFFPKKEKKPKLTLYQGGKHDPFRGK